MHKTLLFGLALAIAGGAHAADAPYYGPAKPWHGIGYKFGYTDDVTEDGSWRVVAAVRSGEPVDMAMYRMAERARDAGYRYILLLGGRETRSPGYRSATLLGRPVTSATPPATCPVKHASSCYTADVAALLRKFGGVTGATPGVAVPDAVDRFGRRVFYAGYGAAKADADAPTPVAPVPIVPRPSTSGRAADDDTVARERERRAMDALRPVHGREPKQGWTISD